MKALAFALVFAVIGVVVGYGIFARTGDGYIEPARFIGNRPVSGLEGLANAVSDRVMDIEGRRQNILIMGAAGAAVGLIIGVLTRRGKTA